MKYCEYWFAIDDPVQFMGSTDALTYARWPAVVDAMAKLGSQPGRPGTTVGKVLKGLMRPV